MRLEEMFEALIKNYEEMGVQNEEKRNQNAYLRCQLGDSMKQRGKAIWNSPSSKSSEFARGEGEEEGKLPWLF